MFKHNIWGPKLSSLTLGTIDSLDDTTVVLTWRFRSKFCLPSSLKHISSHVIWGPKLSKCSLSPYKSQTHYDMGAKIEYMYSATLGPWLIKTYYYSLSCESNPIWDLQFKKLKPCAGHKRSAKTYPCLKSFDPVWTIFSTSVIPLMIPQRGGWPRGHSTNQNLTL